MLYAANDFACVWLRLDLLIGRYDTKKMTQMTHNATRQDASKKVLAVSFQYFPQNKANQTMLITVVHLKITGSMWEFAEFPDTNTLVGL